MLISKRPSVKVEVSGEFNGIIYHVDGARAVDGGDLAANPVWQMERPIRVHLLGKKQSNGSVVVFVDKAELAPAQSGEIES